MVQDSMKTCYVLHISLWKIELLLRSREKRHGVFLASTSGLPFMPTVCKEKIPGLFTNRSVSRLRHGMIIPLPHRNYERMSPFYIPQRVSFAWTSQKEKKRSLFSP